MYDTADSDHPKLRLDSLTSLRFLAALAIVLFHSVFLLIPVGGVSVVTATGYIGVGFFFLLSGFVLTWTFVRGPAWFYWKRFARIYPLYIVTVLIALGLPAPEIGGNSAGPASAAVALVQAWIPRPAYFSGTNGVAWSLSCEAFFYLIFPLLVAAFLRVTIRRPNLIALSLVAFGTLISLAVCYSTDDADPQRFLFYSPGFRLLEFLVGILYARALIDGWRPRIRRRGGSLIAGGAVLSTIICYTVVKEQSGHAPPRQWVDLAMILPFGILVSSVARSDLRQPQRRVLLRNPWMIKLGDWSYALYLVHQLLLRVWVNNEPRVPVELTPIVEFVYVAVAIAIAGLAYEFYERPSERALRRLGRRWAGRHRRAGADEPPLPQRLKLQQGDR